MYGFSPVRKGRVLVVVPLVQELLDRTCEGRVVGDPGGDGPGAGRRTDIMGEGDGEGDMVRSRVGRGGRIKSTTSWTNIMQDRRR